MTDPDLARRARSLTDSIGRGTLKEYACRCPICLFEFTYQSEFLSATRSYSDGRLALSCGAHTAEEISAAWDAYLKGGSR